MSEELLNLNNLQRQEILLRLAIESVAQYSEKYVAMIQAIDELIILTKYEPTPHEKSVLTYCRKLIGTAEAYSSKIKTKTEDTEDINSKAFLKYRQVESQIFEYYPLLKKLQLKLLGKTTLQTMTMMSSHLSIARKSSKKDYETEEEKTTEGDDDEEED